MAVPVLIIGCGVVGPVLALLLQKKGYEPAVFEKVLLGDAGQSIMLGPNGFKVLSLAGLADRALATGTQPLEAYRELDFTGEEIWGCSDLPSTYRDTYSQPAAGVRRTAINLMMKDALLEHGIPLSEGWQLQDLTEDSDGVTAHFSGGRTARGAFCIGADGIKSAARRAIAKETDAAALDSAVFTGLIQTCGFSSMPPGLPRRTLNNWYGRGVHVVAHQIDEHSCSWGITQRSSEAAARETWRIQVGDEARATRDDILSGLQQTGNWDPVVLDMIRGATRLTRFGLYDRPAMEPTSWWSPGGRVVLVGDAAHPTSPHLAQGANQGLEDAFHLVELLPNLRSSSADGDEDLSTAIKREGKKSLGECFRRFAEKRGARTAALVAGARRQGEVRVASDDEAMDRRRADIRRAWSDPAAVAARYHELFKEPIADLS